jgi:hypothetical protein
MCSLRHLLLALWAAAITSLPSWSAPGTPAYCHSDVLGTDSGPDAYAFRDGSRCEGTYRLRMSGGSARLALRSLTSNRSGVSLAGQRHLQISWPSLPAGVRLRISVVPLNSPVLYRMDAEVDGAAGAFQWPADIAHRWFSSYLDLGVLAFYFDQGHTIHVACVLGPVSGAPLSPLRADVLSLESLSRLEVFSRPCRLLADCDSLEAGSLIGTVPGRNRDGAFALNILPPAPSGPDFQRLRFAGQVTNGNGPPLALSIILRAPLAGSASGPQK